MAELVADFLLSRLREWGVHRIYGYPGRRDQRDPGRARPREGRPGVHPGAPRGDGRVHGLRPREVDRARSASAWPPPGPGAIHLLNGLYDAKLDHQPVVAIVGQQAQAALGGNYQQEVDLQTLFKDVAHEYVHMATEPGQIRHLVDRAVRIALDQRTVTCIIVPNDLGSMKAVEQPPHEHGTIHSSVGYSRPVVVPADEDLQRAAEVLNAGEKVAMLVGQGALHASDEVVEVAELLGAGVAKALLGKAALPDDLPFVTGSIGLLGTKPSWDLMQGCDTLLMVGSSFPYSEFLPQEGKARGVQIDLDGAHGRDPLPDGGQPRRRLEGDAREARCRCSSARATARGARRSRSEVEDWWKLIEDRAMQNADPINPQRVFFELSKRLPDGAIISSDSGSAANWYARDVKLRRGMMASLSGTLATMGPGVPYAIAAKFAHPGPAGVRARRRRRVPDERHERADHDREVLPPLDEPAARDPRAAQRRPEPGHVGAAGDGGRPEVRGLAARCPDFPYARLRRDGRPRRGSASTTRISIGAGLGRGARRRPAGRARGDHRPGGAAAAAAHHDRAGEGTS